MTPLLSLFFSSSSCSIYWHLSGRCCTGGQEETGKFIPIYSSVEVVFLMQNQQHQGSDFCQKALVLV